MTKDTVIKVYTVNPDLLFNDLDFTACMQLLSEVRQQEIMNSKLYKDRCQHLAGMLLTRYALQECGMKAEFPYITRSEFGRPLIKNLPYDFNVTHTENLVACAIGKCKLGLDAEKN